MNHLPPTRRPRAQRFLGAKDDAPLFKPKEPALSPEGLTPDQEWAVWMEQASAEMKERARIREERRAAREAAKAEKARLRAEAAGR